MKNSELVKGINAVIEGLELIKKSLLADVTEVVDETVEDVEEVLHSFSFFAIVK